MKNLKKVLSLVLALAMALSLMTAAFAADAGDFADYDSVSHNEAVDVMTAIGVFNGTGNGNNFDPKGTLTREQAAKIIVYMLVGQEDGDKLTTVVAPFSDVSADRWSAGAIAYCANAGILAGTGNGKFNPTGELTGLAFSKMLLVALGYEPTKEGLTGTSWAINAASLGVNAGLAENLTAVMLSGPITREQAAQMAFNTEKATMVAYGGTTSVNTGDAIVTITGDRGWRNDDPKTEGQIATDNRLQFAEEYCTKLVKTSDRGHFGVPATSWYFAGDKIGTYNDTAKLTYTTDIKWSALKKALPSSIATAEFYINGEKKAFTKDTLTSYAATDTKVSNGGNGALIEVYYSYNSNNKGYDVTIVDTETYAAKVADCEKNKDGKYDIKIDSNSNYKFESDVAFAEDTVVLYTWSETGGDDLETMVAAESVTGDTTLVKTKKDKTPVSFTLDGKVYEYAKQFGNDGTTVPDAAETDRDALRKTPGNNSEAAPANNSTNMVVYLDPYGYVIYITEAEVDNNYAVVTDYGKMWAASDNNVKMLMSDGAVKTNEVKGKLKGSASAINWDTDIGLYAIVKYSANADNVYTFSDVQKTSSLKATNAKVQNGVSVFSVDGNNNHHANEKTVFFLYDGSDYSAYVGISNVPSLETTNELLYYTISTGADGMAEAVFLYTDGNVETSSSTAAAYIYKSANDYWYETKDDVKYYTVNAVVDGTATTVDVDEDTYISLGAVGGKLFKSLSVDKNNHVTKATELTGADKVVNASTSYEKAKNGVVTIDSTTYAYSKDVIVYVYDDSDEEFSKKSITSLKDCSISDKYSVTAQLKDDVIIALYYTQP